MVNFYGISRKNIGVYKASRREKLLSFSRYSLYAWGVPLVITGIVTCLDNIDISKWNYIIKPPFDDCFKNEYGVQRYYFIPLGVIMFINIVLFIITIYHILTTTYSTKRNAEFRRSGRENSYKTYMKLSLTMGISWVLELIPNSNNTFIFVLSNSYNSLIGVIIFFVYIFDKNVLNELCKKFNIQNGILIKIARRKSLFRLARSMKANREELACMQAPTTTSTALSSVAENETSLNSF
ncbi:G-protein coupled receptor Mth [Spodoptera litura]|uniref:G-protein coupled receptor Mth n=1 Tax=Spodoptera litura TaxID=69820 RepID=A0A9J7J5C9_SPOLT|nr:G-protein coupled receptor Mth [Spodoptera litura]